MTAIRKLAEASKEDAFSIFIDIEVGPQDFKEIYGLLMRDLKQGKTGTTTFFLFSLCQKAATEANDEEIMAILEMPIIYTEEDRSIRSLIMRTLANIGRVSMISRIEGARSFWESIPYLDEYDPEECQHCSRDDCNSCDISEIYGLPCRKIRELDQELILKTVTKIRERHNL